MPFLREPLPVRRADCRAYGENGEIIWMLRSFRFAKQAKRMSEKEGMKNRRGNKKNGSK